MTTIPKPLKKRLYKKWWVWVLVVIAVIILAIAVTGGSSYQAAQLAQYDYLHEPVQVEERDIQKTISTNGTMTPDETTVILSTFPGRVDAVNVAVGDTVGKDDVLLVIAGQDITAPFDGRIVDLQTFEGDSPQLGIPLIEVGFESNHIEFLASDSEVLDLEVGQNVVITIPAYNNGREEFDGEVSFVGVKKEAVISTATQTAETGYVIQVTSNALPQDITHIIGLTADLTIIVGEKQKALSVVSGAVQYDEDDNPFVYLVPTVDDAFVMQAKGVEDIAEMLQTVDVEIGFEGDEYIEITDGLDKGDEVLLYVPTRASLPF